MDGNTALMVAIGQLGNVSNGVLKDLVLRSAFAKDEGWWDKVSSEFRITEKYYKFDLPSHDGETAGTDHQTPLPLERALDLCGYDVTHSNLGLSLLDLMHMDVDTFSMVEEWVHKYAEEQRKRLPKSIKNELEGK